jgi:epoxyqueuosine reductase
MDRFPRERIWVVAHKTVAVAAGLGVMGLHRNVIHPRFGSFVLLATVVVDAEVSEYGQALDYSPCIDCKLCVAACPVGAISKDGLACTTHNYREFMSGFTDWAQTWPTARTPPATAPGSPIPKTPPCGRAPMG